MANYRFSNRQKGYDSGDQKYQSNHLTRTKSSLQCELSNNFEVGLMLVDLNELGKLKNYCLNGCAEDQRADQTEVGNRAKSENDPDD